jgi:sterol desaturase/sphingolipid hydroxylase (fatty acid hydroxylase superfamily)
MADDGRGRGPYGPPMDLQVAPPVPEAVARTGPRWWRVLLVLGLVAAGFAIDSAAWFGVAALFALVVPFEKLFPRHPQQLRRPGVGTDLAYAMAQPLLGAVGIAVAVVVGIASLAWLPGLLIRPLVAQVPPLPQMLLGIALFDLAVYWAHRWGHEVPFLWRFHSIHHSNERMDWISGLRTHPLDGALIAPAFVLLLGAGFSQELTGLLAVVQIVTGLFLHANVRWRWRPLHRLVATPEFHHWHHSNEPDAHFSNYAAFLPAWDLVFGTYFVPAHRRPQRYGVDEPIPAGLVDQLWHPLRGLTRPWPLLRHPARGLRHLGALLRRGLAQLVASAQRPRRAPGRA